MRAALVQITASDDPEANLDDTAALISRAVDEGADFVLTPEVTNCVSASRTRQSEVLKTEESDPTLRELRAMAAKSGVWILIGSLALKTRADDGRFVNRSFLIGPDGAVCARYDKMHMFDVEISETETYRESEGYRPGDTAVLANALGTKLGMTICYDIRFPYLYRDLSKAGAKVLAVPSAFAPDTGAAHWETLLRARAIENGAFVLAPAQCGRHPSVRGRQRQTHGHSLAVDPWGTVLADGGELPGVTLVDLKLEAVDDARRRIPSLQHDQHHKAP